MPTDITSPRVAAFVDGFNVYHFLTSLRYRHLKWLDYRRLCEQLLPRNTRLVSVQYFTAKASWDPLKQIRHNLYIRALKAKGIEVVLGKFKHTKKKMVIKNEASRMSYKTVEGNRPGSIFYGYSFEEKQTDVSIACEMISRAARDCYDIALLVSGDTDFEPALRTVMSDFGKTVWVAVPNKRIAGSIKSIVPHGQCISLKRKLCESAIMEDPVVLDDGTTLNCPDTWK